MVNIIVICGLGFVCFAVGYYQGYGGILHRREHAKFLQDAVELEREALELRQIMISLGFKSSNFSDRVRAETQRFWDKMLGFEENYGSKD